MVLYRADLRGLLARFLERVSKHVHQGQPLELRVQDGGAKKVRRPKDTLANHILVHELAASQIYDLALKVREGRQLRRR